VKRSEETKAKTSDAMKGNTNRKGRKASEEAKGKISAGMKGNTNRKDKGKAVYLYIVRANALELSATFHNRERASESLGMNRTTLYRYITNRTLFKMNGVSHVVSWDANLS
jgi:hypothetical protein